MSNKFVILVSVNFASTPEKNYYQNRSLIELYRLAETAGYQVMGELNQQRSSPDAALFIGLGKIEELKTLINNYGVGTVIFDHELSPVQQRNLEQELKIKVMDRTELILNIFSGRANTKEGKLQVELAQLNYLYPRLVGKGKQLSRLGGGIGTRGPGEKKLEVDRRTVRRRISNLNREIEKVKKHRTLQRDRRKKMSVPLISLVGYTNAGKSTLLNALTGSDVYVENQLFATLDPISRKTKLPSGQQVIFTDTVGFIQNLPTQLIAAFRATLEEINQTDLIIHVVDLSSEYYLEQVESVYKVLKQIGASEKAIITALNKAESIPYEILERSKRELPNAVPISAKTKLGLDNLLLLIDNCLSSQTNRVKAKIPYDKIVLVNLFYNSGSIEKVEYLEDGIQITGVIRNTEIEQFSQYLLFVQEDYKC